MASKASGDQTNQPNREELLRLAIGAAKAGNEDSARVMFRRVLADDKRNERAMMWMAKLAQTRAERKEWLSRVLVVNPDNDSAKDALRQMKYKSTAKENRTLLIFGTIAGILVVLVLVAILFIALRPH
jgi:Tfp pilus assembly protein PilF